METIHPPFSATRTIMLNLDAARFFELFEGLDRAYGTYTVRSFVDKKAQGVAATVRGTPSPELWEDHLEGKDGFGLGIIPIRDDGTCIWGAIDVDIYPLDHRGLIKKIVEIGLPLILCTTKSGGAHLYLLLKEPIAAEIVRSKLMEWALILGYPKVEVFPKQTRLAGINDIGNWLNMPYQGGKKTSRYGFTMEGEPLERAAFLDYVWNRRLSLEGLLAITPKYVDPNADILYQGPPCLQALAREGIPSGSRNNALFNFAVYLKKRYGDDWESHLGEVNHKFLNPPLSVAEMGTIIKSLKKKAYSYRCKEAPIVGVCNRQICLTRDHGVGKVSELGDDPGVDFGAMKKIRTDPPSYIWSVNGMNIEFSTEELMDQRLLAKKCIDELDVWPKLVKPSVWRELVQDRIAASEKIDPPEDATPEGQFFLQVEYFCTGRAMANSMDEMLLGRPYHDKARKSVCFRSSDLFAYLAQKRVRITEKKVYNWLRKRGLSKEFQVLKGKGINFWIIPEFETQKESFDVPRIDDAPF